MKNHIIVRIVALSITLITLTVLLVGNTFSWYKRAEINDTNNYNKFSYEKTGKINYDTGDAEVNTYLGTLKNGDIVYDMENPVSSTSDIDVNAGTPTYFKTVIENNDTSGDSVVSLYLTSLGWSDTLGNTIHIGVMQPEKTYKDFTSTARDLGRTCIEDNIILAKGTTVEIVWYIKSDVNADGTVNLGAQYPVYN